MTATGPTLRLLPHSPHHPAAWPHRAACRDYDPELWFPLDGSPNIATAKAICAYCPAAQECLQWALDTRATSGIYGGLTVQERTVQERGALSRRTRADPAAARWGQRWTDTERAIFLHMYADGYSDPEIAAALERTTPAVKQLRLRLGLAANQKEEQHA